MKWHPVELHTHTQHSDGDFTVRELVRAIRRHGFHAVCLSDHNTMSGLPELYKAAGRENIVPIPGIEWTTYWGHMLVLDEHGYTDWRGVQPEEIDAAIASIHRNHGEHRICQQEYRTHHSNHHFKIVLRYLFPIDKHRNQKQRSEYQRVIRKCPLQISSGKANPCPRHAATRA